MSKRRFVQCDVFSPIPTKGNALAVVIDGEGLDQQSMQQFAAWTGHRLRKINDRLYLIEKPPQ